MKVKLVFLATALAAIFPASSEAGLGINIAIGGGGYCAPLCYRPAPVCYTTIPYFYGSYGYWGQGGISYASSTRFSNVSPLLNYAGNEAPVVRVPAPVALTDAEPITVSPIAPFTWKN